MTRRGNRGTVSASTSSATGTNRWNRSRPHSANSSDVKSKSSDSTRSSPTVSNESTSSSPPAGKKSGSRARASSYWRSEKTSALSGGERARGTPARFATDSKFSLTNNEDFPALPGAPRGGGGSRSGGGNGTAQSTPSKHYSKKGMNGGGNNVIVSREMATTDDSGVSTSSRCNTPATEKPDNRKGRGSVESAKQKPDIQEKRRSAPLRSPFGTTSPAKKKSINASNSGSNTASSFMKLSKLGQKIPERRGVTRHSQPSELSKSPITVSPISEKESRPIMQEVQVDPKLTQEMVEQIAASVKITPSFETDKQLVPPIQAHPPPVDQCPSIQQPSVVQHSEDSHIIVSGDGFIDNIPASMLNDQYGLAGYLPVLKLAGLRREGIEDMTLSKEQRELNANICAVCVGMDLASLDVPLRTSETGIKYLYETFNGPFGDHPLAPPSISLNMHQVPNVYYTSNTLSAAFDMIQDVPDKLSVHDLFYLYYNMPRELWQINAARELMYRGWRFNIVERLWVHKKRGEPDEFGITISVPQNPFTQPEPGADDIMMGIFEIYDAEKARITSREMCLKRSEFEVPAWEQKTPDRFTQVLNDRIPKTALWGPRVDRQKQSNLLQGLAGIIAPPSRPVSVAQTTRVPNLPTHQTSSQNHQQCHGASSQLHQANSRRPLLSFADSPDTPQSTLDTLFQMPAQMSNNDLCRQQMMAVLYQRLQMQHQQQLLNQQAASGAAFSSVHQAASSSSSSAAAATSSSTNNSILHL